MQIFDVDVGDIGAPNRCAYLDFWPNLPKVFHFREVYLRGREHTNGLNCGLYDAPNEKGFTSHAVHWCSAHEVRHRTYVKKNYYYEI